MKYYLAIDIGASSGRHIIGYKKNNEIVMDEVYRFENGVKEEEGHLIWDIDSILTNVKEGIDIALNKYKKIESLSIDTWGVDYVLMNEDQEIVPCYAYRDHRMEEVIEEVHSIIPFSKLYKRTGIQFQPFNTIYQLYWDHKHNRLQQASDFLLIPEYLMYKLCGIKAHEYTNATTGGMIHNGTYDEEIIDALHLPKHLFKTISQPKTILGTYKGIPVVLCATHDTGSAVEGIPMEGNEPYISSGTWSLLGIKTDHVIQDKESEKANYSNEGGVGYNRYQKNIMGMWIINNLKEEMCPQLHFDEIVKLSKESTFDEIVDVNDSIFLSPKSMKEALESKVKPNTLGDYFRCAYRSLAYSYKEALEELEKNTNKKYSSIYIVGGGAKNTFLNELTQQITNKQVIALPIEATALGNLKIQMEVQSYE